MITRSAQNFSLCLLSALLLLGGCGSDEEIRLEGDRISVLELERSLIPEARPDNISLSGDLPDAWSNAFWPQSGGYPNHSMQHLALSGDELEREWRVDIGSGGSKNLPITAQPIVVYGKVFTLDTDSSLRAFDAESGKELWDISVQHPDEDDPVIGGGISYASGVVYVTNGFDEVLAVHPDNGQIFWRSTISAPARAAPTIIDGRLFVMTLDNRLQAIDAASGDFLWEYVGISETAGLLGAASPAANHDVVVPAFSSGEVAALRVENGSTAWTENLSSLSSFAGISSLSDINAMPVLDKGLVFAISFSGRLVAIDERTGARVWQRDLGGSNTPWVAGDYVFIVTSENQLVALERASGIIQWAEDLKGEDDDDPVFFNGPVLAGGRLIVTSSEGRVLEFNPVNGGQIREWRAGGALSLPPLVADETLYILDDNATLSAYK
ncbi:MAG: PQQ-binding-like beta-propeller repeat protein [Pseudomonadota bacterium]